MLKFGDLRKYLKKNLDRLEVGKDIVKYATHGFWGNVKDLLRLYVEGNNDYEVMHMTKPRQSLRQNKTNNPELWKSNKGK